ncbi:toxin-activating lysine-acyltransferase [Pelagibius marinus]|uniref:toxin-activating lysine-acyltransferase n=1 Tax=Pelagibius marinus TaxID=2762760 RepID=UPI0018724A26|nr:toxin-activating lysine-acyltransferase [Pelagibius marinus]
MTGSQGAAAPNDRVTAKSRNTPAGAAPDGGKRSPDQLLRAAFARASQVFGQAVSIFMQSPQHRHLLISDLEWRLIPPIALQQYRLVQHKGTPAGFVSWALVDEETEERLQQPDFRLRPQDWKCGERVWIIDVVAPAAQAQTLVEKVKAEVFEGREVQVRKGVVIEGEDRSKSSSCDDS